MFSDPTSIKNGTPDEVEKLGDHFIAKSELIIRQNALIETGTRGEHGEFFGVCSVFRCVCVFFC